MQANGVQACVVCDQEAAIYSIVPGVIIKYGGLRLSKPSLTWNSLGTEFLLEPAISGSLTDCNMYHFSTSFIFQPQRLGSNGCLFQ